MTNIRKARKIHKCAECPEPIKPGQTYRDSRSRLRLGVAIRTHIECAPPSVTKPALPRLDAMGRCQDDPWYDATLGTDDELDRYGGMFTSKHDGGW